MSTAVVHLVWAPLGPRPLREFLASYRAHDAGAEHELVVLLNGLAPGNGEAGPRARLLAELEGTPYRLLELPRAELDLAAYGRAAALLEHELLCFLNSYAVILADGWLAHLARAFDANDVGLAGATGSWESQAEWVRGRARHWPYQLARLAGDRRDYPRFPNPHVRTAAFMLPSVAVRDLRLERAADKRATYLLESGRASITRTVQERGMRAVVVGRDGHVYDVQRWPHSATYRSGAQRNLLVGDRRTRDWERAPARLRRRLTRDAWGDAADVAGSAA